MDSKLILPDNDFAKTFVLVLLYVTGFAGLHFFLNYAGISVVIPTEANLCRWDAGFYREIAEQGYHTGAGQNNSGFFFLFPLLWYLFQLNVWGVCLMNILFFAIGFSLLSGLYKLSMADKLIWLSVPTVYFIFVPYSEALFFLLSTLCIYGIQKDKKLIIWISIYLLSMTRATTIFLVPAFFMMELLGAEKSEFGRSMKLFLVRYFVPSVTGLTTFVLVQYWKTGVWFAYFIQQSKYWERRFNFPVLPFSQLDWSIRIIWFCALAMFVCFIALIYLVQLIYKWVIRNQCADKVLLLSLTYLAMTLYVIVFYNPIWGTNTTLVIGASRYALVNPFFYVVLYHFTNRFVYNWRHFIFIFALSTLFWLAFGSYRHLHDAMFFSMNTIWIIFYMLYANKRITWPGMVIMALSFFFQVLFFQQFLSGLFPD